MTGAVLTACLLPFTYFWYVSGRSSIFTIELLIPLMGALLPAYLVGYIITKLVYTNQ